jgi:hypothetical protein
MLPNWIIEKEREERDKSVRPRLHAPSPLPPCPREEISHDSREEERGSTEVNYSF